MEEQNLSNMDPRRASFWSSWVLLNNDTSYLMSSCLRSLLSLAESPEKANIMVHQPEFKIENASRALSSILSPATPQSILIRNSYATTNEDGLKSNVIRRWIDAIFGKTNEAHLLPSHASSDSVVLGNSGNLMTEETDPRPGSAVKNVQNSTSHLTENVTVTGGALDIYEELYDTLAGCKSAPQCSLTSRICVALAHVLCARNSSMAKFSQLWSAITHELQKHYEENICIPGLNKSLDPDLSSCKLHQNLQLLQCAVEAKKRNELKNGSASTWEQHIPEEDEFFDAQESIDEVNAILSEKESNFAKPDGRLRPFGSLCLLHYPGILMYEPVTQSRTPVTEDMLEKHTDYIASLTDPLERVQAQLEPLFSDMEAFKAANPGCCFEDFVRWHSPRDFIVDDEKTGKGHLSSRMAGEDNMWQQTWEQAQPKPIHRQKKLFDYSRAASKVISDLENITVSRLIVSILPVLFKCASAQLVDESKLYIALVGSKLLDLCKKVSKSTKSGDLEDYLDALKDMNQIEKMVASCHVLYSHLVSALDGRQNEDEKHEIRQFVMSLIRLSEEKCKTVISEEEANCQVPVERGLCGPVGIALSNVFFRPSTQKSANVNVEKRTLEEILTGDKNMPYRRRQYILRCCARRPTLGSRTLPQRLYAVISKEEYRICLALSSDTVLS